MLINYVKDVGTQRTTILRSAVFLEVAGCHWVRDSRHFEVVGCVHLRGQRGSIYTSLEPPTLPPQELPTAKIGTVSA
jgi:hypothetical protein